jgi:hypothetical protein
MEQDGWECEGWHGALGVSLKHDPDAYDAAYGAFLAALGNPTNLPADVKPKLLTYLQGRAFRKVFEPQF